MIKITEKIVEKGEQPAISLPQKIDGDKYYSINAVRSIGKAIVNLKYGDFAEYRQGKKGSDKDCKVKDESSKVSRDKSDG